MTNRKRILVLGHPAKRQVEQAVQTVLPWLAQRAEIVGDRWVDQMASVPQADLAVVLGGDGTILTVARWLADRGVPILGINLGKLGYLAEFSMDEAREQIDQILAGNMRVSPRMMLQSRIVQADGPADGRLVLALNDVVIAAGEPFRLIELRAWVGPDVLATYYGDGLIMSTPSGSTAYNMAAGGPIVAQDLDAIVVTPICPHSLNFRPVVLPGATSLQIEAVRTNPGTSVIIDGQVSTRLAAGDRIEVGCADRPCLLVENPRYPRYHTWGAKLNWGRRPRSE